MIELPVFREVINPPDVFIHIRKPGGNFGPKITISKSVTRRPIFVTDGDIKAGKV